MEKMILDPVGGIVMTSDGNAILREIDVSHPAAKSMIELSRTQDEEVGDGTTSVIVLAGEILSKAEALVERTHPIVIVEAYRHALDDALTCLKELAIPLDLGNHDKLLEIVGSTLGTKFVSRFGSIMPEIAIDAVFRIARDVEGTTRKEIDLKRFARIEKIPGGELEDSKVLDGVMLNKDVTHPKMRRYIENPRIVLLDTPLEYKKGESQTNIELKSKADFENYLKQEEQVIERMCASILKLKPDVVITEKGVSDYAQHLLIKGNVSVIRRLRKSDNNRCALATGATIGNRPDLLTEADVGTGCGLFEIRKVGDEYFTFLVKCKNPKACTIVLRGGSKDVLMEVERNLQDALSVVRSIVQDPRVLPGGGATEMALAAYLRTNAKVINGAEQVPYSLIADALEVIPRVLVQNCGGRPMETLSKLRKEHAAGNSLMGIDGKTGAVVSMTKLGIWEPALVKEQTLKTSIESACMLLRIDDIVAAKGKGQRGGGGQGPVDPDMDDETFGDHRDG